MFCSMLLKYDVMHGLCMKLVSSAILWLHLFFCIHIWIYVCASWECMTICTEIIWSYSAEIIWPYYTEYIWWYCIAYGEGWLHNMVKNDYIRIWHLESCSPLVSFMKHFPRPSNSSILGAIKSSSSKKSSGWLPQMKHTLALFTPYVRAQSLHKFFKITIPFLQMPQLCRSCGTCSRHSKQTKRRMSPATLHLLHTEGICILRT
jgi:hypothetical protein